MTQELEPHGKALTLALTGGGTAGHVWPHFALFDSPAGPLKKAWNEGQLRVVYFGSQEGMERSLVETVMGSAWTYVPVQTGKLRRYFSLKNFVDPFRIVVGFAQALLALRREKVGVLFSKGGFVSAPVVWAAWVLRIPVVIHESDVTPALATRLTLPFARWVLTAFPGTQKYLPSSVRPRLRNTGLPLRASLFSSQRSVALQHFGISSEKPVLLVFGGSLGARALNRAVEAAHVSLLEHFEVLHIVGKGKADDVDLPRDLAGYHQFEFLGEDMKHAYAAADLALCRAGASTLFELAAARIPMVLVPLGLDQSRGDQIVNAKIFSEQGWACVLPEKELQPETLVRTCREMLAEKDVWKARLDSAPGLDASVQVSELIWKCAHG